MWRRNRETVPARREESPLVALQRDMNRLFEDFWRGFALPSPIVEAWGMFMPRVDVEDRDGEVYVTAELPGLEEKDVEVQLAGDTLVLRGEKHEEREDGMRGWRERTYGAFERSIPLPCEVDADQASAAYEHGVLRITLPKSPRARERTKRIQVTVS
jgi:HSP20 family protein